MPLNPNVFFYFLFSWETIPKSAIIIPFWIMISIRTQTWIQIQIILQEKPLACLYLSLWTSSLCHPGLCSMIFFSNEDWKLSRIISGQRLVLVTIALSIKPYKSSASVISYCCSIKPTVILKIQSGHWCNKGWPPEHMAGMTHWPKMTTDCWGRHTDEGKNYCSLCMGHLSTAGRSCFLGSEPAVMDLLLVCPLQFCCIGMKPAWDIMVIQFI